MKNCNAKNNCIDHQTIFFFCAILMVFAWAIFGFDTSDGAKTASAPSENGTEKAEAGPVLDATTSPTTRYLPVIFATHDQHVKRQEGNCKKCHHDIDENGKTPATCSSCHNASDIPVKLAEAMHKSCKGCHLEAKKKDGKSAAPVECMGCHKERK